MVDTVPDAAAVRITCRTGDDHRLNAVTIQITAAYGTYLLALAERVHLAAGGALAAVLGDLRPPQAAIRTHVHIGDVVDDPRVVR